MFELLEIEFNEGERGPVCVCPVVVSILSLRGGGGGSVLRSLLVCSAQFCFVIAVLEVESNGGERGPLCLWLVIECSPSCAVISVFVLEGTFTNAALGTSPSSMSITMSSCEAVSQHPHKAHSEFLMFEGIFEQSMIRSVTQPTQQTQEQLRITGESLSCAPPRQRYMARLTKHIHTNTPAKPNRIIMPSVKVDDSLSSNDGVTDGAVV